MSKALHSGLSLNAMEHEAIAWAQKLISGEMTVEDVEALKRWSALSPAHSAAFAEARRVWSKFGAAGSVLHDPNEDFLAALDALGQHRRTMSRRKVLGGGVVALAAATVYGVIDPPLGLWPSLSELGADYRTGTGEQRYVTFADNVAINLNTQTSLAVQPTEGAEDRIEMIAGEASFATLTRASRPLVVLAASGKTITESGRFDVRCITSGERSAVSITSYDGRVRIEHGAERAYLEPGQRMQYDAAGLSQAAAVDPVASSNWQRGIIEFQATPLAEAVEEVNRYRPGRIILMNPGFGQKKISGRFRIDQMNVILSQLEQAFDAKLRRLPGGIVLLSRA